MKVLRILLMLSLLIQSGLTQPVENPLSISFQPELGEEVPVDLEFTDQTGQTAPLRGFMGERPTLLVLGYYGCPMLCHKVQEGLLGGLNTSSLRAGGDFQIVMISIDPGESPELAAEKRRAYIQAYSHGSQLGPDDWPFLVGEEKALAALQEAVGFQSARLEDQIAHPAGLVVLSPRGKITSYLDGIRFPALALERGIKKASREELSSPLRRVLLLCYQYDPATGRYSLAIYRLIQWLGLFTVLCLGLAVLRWLKKERGKSRGGQ